MNAFLRYIIFITKSKAYGMVSRTLKVPSESIIADGFGRIDYVDSYSVPVGRGEPVDRLVTKIFCNGPAWVDKLMALRDAVVGWVSKPLRERGNK